MGWLVTEPAAQTQGEAGDSHIPHISSSPGGREAGKPWLEPSALRTPRLADSWPGLGSGSGCASAPLKLLEVLEPPAQKQSPRQADWHPRRCPAISLLLARLASVSQELPQTFGRSGPGRKKAVRSQNLRTGVLNSSRLLICWLSQSFTQVQMSK